MTDSQHRARTPQDRPDTGRGADPLRSEGGIHHVLICLDSSHASERVLPHAIAVLRGFGARGTLLQVLEPPAAAAGVPADLVDGQIQRAEAEGYLEQIVARYGSAEAPLAIELAEGEAAAQICRWAEAHEVDLTVLSSHGSGGPSAYALASTARKLVEGLSGSLLIVPLDAPPVAEGDQELRYRRVAVPLDGSAWAETALPVALRMAAAHGAELLLVHVVPEPELTGGGPRAPEDAELVRRIVERNERVARSYLAELEKHLEGRVDALRIIVARDEGVRRSLVRIIDAEKVDLVVMSAHGSSARHELPHGQVAAHLVCHCPVPLLLVRVDKAVAAGRGASARTAAPPRLPLQATRD